MALKIDKDTRLIDVDFGPVSVSCGRTAGNFDATSVSFGQNGIGQIIAQDEVGDAIPGSFVQYERIDLQYMTMNNEVMQPVEVSVQRTSPVPLGSNINGNAFDQIEEYIYIFSRPLNNDDIADRKDFDQLRQLGLDRSQALTAASQDLGGKDAGYPTHVQTIYAEKRMYSYSTQTGATVSNGQLEGPPVNLAFNEIYGMPVLDSVTTWGTLSPITGPNLHCYRLVINRTQNFPNLGPNVFTSVNADGSSSINLPPVNVAFLCKDPGYTEGEYITTIANAMNSLPEGGPSNA
tara:strand:+ start:1335 stop:2207 length:873 start_codon:yes stop_codon:yes gene_type:complete